MVLFRVVMFGSVMFALAGAEEPQGKLKSPQRTKYIWDVGTLWGAGAQMACNGGRCCGILHEMKKFFKGVTQDTAGNSADALVKLYDRDDFSNAVVGQGLRRLA